MGFLLDAKDLGGFKISSTLSSNLCSSKWLASNNSPVNVGLIENIEDFTFASS